MSEFNDNVAVGDTLNLVMNFTDRKWEAKVIDVTDTVIICEINLDMPRKIEFDRKTGVHIEGECYGWLESQSLIKVLKISESCLHAYL